MDLAKQVIQNGEPVLVVKLADIGDAVLALPAIQALRATLPDSTIDVLSTNAGALVFRRSQAVDEVITLAKQRFDHIRGLISFTGAVELVRLTARLRSRRYRAVVILHHLTTAFGARKFRALARATGAPFIAGLDNGRGTFLSHRAEDYGFGAMTEWQYGLGIVRSLGIDARASRPLVQIPDSARRSADSLLKNTGIRGSFALIHAEVGEFSPARGWRDDYFGDVARSLITSMALPVVTVGVDSGRTGLGRITSVDGVSNLVGKTTFEELCALVAEAELVIGCDSSVAHLAAGFDRPAITLFGPSNREAWMPYGATPLSVDTLDFAGSRSVALSREMPCSPCLYTGFRLGRPQGCRSRSCLMDLGPDAVIRIAGQLLHRTQ